VICSLDLGHIGMALVEGRGRHHHHRHVDHPRDRQRRDHLDVREPQELAPLRVVPHRDPPLRKAGVQVDRMGHHRGTDNADGDRQCRRIRQRRGRQPRHGPGPVHRRDQHLGKVAKPDDEHEGADHQFHRAEALTLEDQYGVSQDGSDRHPRHQRQPEQQREPDGAAEEFGKIRRHRGDLADRPHDPDHRPGKIVSAELGEILAGDDAEPGGERLEEHGDDICQKHDPEQRIGITRPRLDVRRVIAGVHVGHRGDDRRPGEDERPQPAPGLARKYPGHRVTGSIAQGLHRGLGSGDARNIACAILPSIGNMNKA
jgi:hypothetical protein